MRKFGSHIKREGSVEVDLRCKSTLYELDVNVEHFECQLFHLSVGLTGFIRIFEG